MRPRMKTQAPTADFWPSSGHGELHRTTRGWLQPSPAWLRRWLARPELALVDESCAAERALHAALAEHPERPVTAAELAALQDADARSNYAAFVPAPEKPRNPITFISDCAIPKFARRARRRARGV